MIPTKTPIEANGFNSIFKNSSFLLLWAAQIFSQVADKVLLILLIALLPDYAPIPGLKGSMYSLLLEAFTLPAIFFGITAGILVD